MVYGLSADNYKMYAVKEKNKLLPDTFCRMCRAFIIYQRSRFVVSVK